LVNFPEDKFNIMMVDQTQKKMVNHLKNTIDNVNTPLQKLEDALYPLVTYFIIPLFALSNAGVAITGGTEAVSYITPITLGVIAGLLLGKPVGIILFSWLAVKAGIALLPEGVSWKLLWGVACIAGIGFTMSLFIANLAFADAVLLHQAKMGILLGSMFSVLLGMSILWLTSSPSQKSSN